MAHNSLVYRSSSSTEAVIQRTIEGIQKMIRVRDSPPGEEGKAVIQINPAMKRHWESEIKILREAPRDEKKLREILKVNKKSMKNQKIVKI
jgi:hypothetical protein